MNAGQGVDASKLKAQLVCRMLSVVLLLATTGHAQEEPKPLQRGLSRIDYEMQLEGTALNGTLTMTVEEPGQAATLTLGKTNLRSLRLLSGRTPISLASDSSGNLIPLVSFDTDTISGTYRAKGETTGKVTTFDLRLPPAEVAAVRLVTATGIRVSSSDGLVVSARQTETQATWTIYPRNPRQLKLACTDSDAMPGELRSDLEASATVDISTGDSGVLWDISASGGFPEGMQQFELSAKCTIVEARADSVPLEFTQNGNRVVVQIPESGISTLVLRAELPAATDQEVWLPFLKPVAGANEDAPSLRAGQVRVRVSPELLVRDIQMSGLLERDTSLAADGTLTIDLAPFQLDPTATVKLTDARPVVRDSIAVLPEFSDEAGLATAWIHIQPSAGTIGQAEWKIPSSWRVTELKVAGSGEPTLYRTVDTDSQWTELHVIFRNPLTSESSLTLEARLQNADPTAAESGDIPTFVSDTWTRNVEYLFVKEADLGRFPWADQSIVDPPEWMDSLSPESVAWFATPSEQPSRERVFQGDSLFWNINYETALNGDRLDETLILELRTSDRFPRELQFQTTSPADLDVRVANGNQPLSATRGGVEAGVYTWNVSLSDDLIPLSDLTLRATASRPLTSGRLKATLVSVRGAQSAGGIIQSPVAPLVYSGPEQSAGSVPYPSQPLTYSLQITRLEEETASPVVSGMLFTMFTADDAGAFCSESHQELDITKRAEQTQITLSVPESDHLVVRVDDRPVTVSYGEGGTTIPLPSNATRTRIALTWYQTGQEHQEMSVAPAVVDGAENQTLNAIVILPEGFVSNLAGKKTGSTECRAAVSRLVNESAQGFQGRWNLAAVNGGFLLPDVSVAVPVRLHNRFLDASLLALAAFVAFGLGWVVCRFLDSGLWLSAVAAAGLIFVPLPVVWDPARLGIVLGTLVLVCLRASTSRRWMPATAVFLLLSGHAPIAQAQVDGEIPSNVESDALVLKTRTTATFESPQSCLVKIECEVASLPDSKSVLRIPGDDPALISASLDGKAVFPVRTADGLKLIMNRPPPSQLSPEQGVQADGPRSIGPWNLRKVAYTYRALPTINRSNYRIRVAVPPAADSMLQFNDESGLSGKVLVEDSGRLRTVTSEVMRLEDSTVDRIELTVQSTGATSTVEADENSGLICTADLRPARQRLTCEYFLTDSETAERNIAVGVSPVYQVVDVATRGGDPLKWSLRDNMLTVEVEPVNGEQRFVVQLQTDRATSVRQTIPVGLLAGINGTRAGRVVLYPVTDARFYVAGVTAEKEDLTNQLVVPGGDETEAQGRAADLMLRVPDDCESLEVELAAVPVSREPRLTQTAIVRESSVDWTLNASINLAGQPVFRQVIRISGAVRITDVTAQSEGVSRIHSWTQDGDQLVISLRQAARSELILEVNGVLDRLPDQELLLPFVTIPDTSLLESVLLLSAGPRIDATISALGGARPDDVLDDMTVPANPLRFTLQEERPLSISASERKQIGVDAVVFLYNEDQNQRCAVILNVQAVDVGSTLQFRGPAGATSAKLMLDDRFRNISAGDGGLFSERLSRTGSTPIIFDDVIPGIRDGMLTAPLPEFKTEVEIRSSFAFDLRYNNAINVRSAAPPDWALAAADAAEIDARTSGVLPVSCSVSESGEVVRMSVKTGVDSQEESTVDSVFSQGHHRVTWTDSGYAGHTAFTVFHPNSSVVTLKVPVEVCVTQITVNGKSQTLRSDGTGFEVAVAGAVSTIEVHWLNTLSSSLFRLQDDIRLPEIDSARARTTASLHLRDRPIWHGFPLEQISRTQLSEIQTIRLHAGVQFATQSSEIAGDPDLAKYAEEINDYLNEQSPGALAARDRFMNAVAESELLINLNDANLFAVSIMARPSMKQSTLGGGALLTLLLSVVFSRRRRVSAKASDTQTEAGEPAVES